jgi:hypothetical protein
MVLMAAATVVSTAVALITVGVAMLLLPVLALVVVTVARADPSVLTSNGVLMRPYPWDHRPLLVPWSEVTGVWFGRIGRFDFLHVVPRDPWHYVTGGSLRRAYLRGQTRQYGTPLHLWIGTRAHAEVQAAVTYWSSAAAHGRGLLPSSTSPTPGPADRTLPTPARWTPALAGLLGGVGLVMVGVWVTTYRWFSTGGTGTVDGGTWVQNMANGTAATVVYAAGASVALLVLMGFLPRPGRGRVRARRTARWRRGMLTVGAAAAVLALIAVAGHEVWWLATAEPATIHVESCRQSYNSANNLVTSCTGGWQGADGRAGRGSVGGVGSTAVGQIRLGWASGSTATTNRTERLSLPLGVGAAVVTASTLFLARRIGRASRPARRSPRIQT